ncbi:RNA-binding cell elongation regulator Jag/EloR [Ethanoligenens harbinense]|uniref:RNA-binding protein KhpB n=1 Tax=Ethanoligenens harbinense (strain DSM 18485 / JCM 12961 / CGMCC 1.5033 / YUAN-3) TaxID=663278 RepID=E6U8G9_ETHHY|nr:RNA-binding cell elongation regulator Jag/EloR [Ethanoligenens harbinense]ADU28288.1 single-stranded nucleic acid binding R3H domain-containing protein [Ethanoligenens harbinense YUAN-3]AVQ97282.1 protein jag [Ethanoligenens harbinense YUAN-3]AYF39946.1 protein jag [Ethanoligenens harbinense]AYF42776.1 protein jag [Ethanoligenens harbinense]QCN93526.1 protein jag [Ethanoligenens harbinense]
MKREAVAAGRTVEDAIQAACEQLAAERNRVEIEVLQLPSKRLLGLLGASEAKVRATVEFTAEERADYYLSGILDRMGVSGYALESKAEGEDIDLNIQGENLGLVIGHRGETLDALQYLASLAANRGEESFKHISLDTGDYRKKREKTLYALAKRLALGAVKTKRTTTLEPMNPYERRIIHTAVQQVHGAASWSVGAEPNRRVVIGAEKQHKRTT